MRPVINVNNIVDADWDRAYIFVKFPNQQAVRLVERSMGQDWFSQGSEVDSLNWGFDFDILVTEINDVTMASR